MSNTQANQATVQEYRSALIAGHQAFRPDLSLEDACQAKFGRQVPHSSLDPEFLGFRAGFVSAERGEPIEVTLQAITGPAPIEFNS